MQVSNNKNKVKFKKVRYDRWLKLFVKIDKSYNRILFKKYKQYYLGNDEYSYIHYCDDSCKMNKNHENMRGVNFKGVLVYLPEYRKFSFFINKILMYYTHLMDLLIRFKLEMYLCVPLVYFTAYRNKMSMYKFRRRYRLMRTGVYNHIRRSFKILSKIYNKFCKYERVVKKRYNRIKCSYKHKSELNRFIKRTKQDFEEYFTFYDSSEIRAWVEHLYGYFFKYFVREAFMYVRSGYLEPYNYLYLCEQPEDIFYHIVKERVLWEVGDTFWERRKNKRATFRWPWDVTSSREKSLSSVFDPDGGYAKVWGCFKEGIDVWYYMYMYVYYRGFRLSRMLGHYDDEYLIVLGLKAKRLRWKYLTGYINKYNRIRAKKFKQVYDLALYVQQLGTCVWRYGWSFDSYI